MKPLRVGLIGTGNISRAHFAAFRQFPDRVRLVAVCDSIRERAQQAAAEFQVPAFDRWDEMLSSVELDAVDICLPHVLHYPAAKDALLAGKHVLVEKPFANTLKECLDLVELAEARGLTLMVAHRRRYEPGTRRLKRLVDEGRLGAIRHARVDAIQNLRDYVMPPHWLYYGKAAGGGGVISVLVHGIDTLRYLIGDARRVAAFGRTADPAFTEAEDYAVAIAEFECGAIVDFFSTYSAAALPYGEMIWLFGDNGVVHRIPEEGVYYRETPRVALRAGERSTTEFADLDGDDLMGLPTADGFVNEILDFADCIRTGEEPISSGRRNLGTMAVVAGIYESIRLGGVPVDVSDIKALAERTQ